MTNFLALIKREENSSLIPGDKTASDAVLFNSSRDAQKISVNERSPNNSDFVPGLNDFTAAISSDITSTRLIHRDLKKCDKKQMETEWDLSHNSQITTIPPPLISRAEHQISSAVVLSQYNTLLDFLARLRSIIQSQNSQLAPILTQSITPSTTAPPKSLIPLFPTHMDIPLPPTSLRFLEQQSTELFQNAKTILEYKLILQNISNSILLFEQRKHDRNHRPARENYLVQVVESISFAILQKQNVFARRIGVPDCLILSNTCNSNPLLFSEAKEFEIEKWENDLLDKVNGWVEKILREADNLELNFKKLMGLRERLFHLVVEKKRLIVPVSQRTLSNSNQFKRKEKVFESYNNQLTSLNQNMKTAADDYKSDFLSAVKLLETELRQINAAMSNLQISTVGEIEDGDGIVQVDDELDIIELESTQSRPILIPSKSRTPNTDTGSSFNDTNYALVQSIPSPTHSYSPIKSPLSYATSPTSNLFHDTDVPISFEKLNQIIQYLICRHQILNFYERLLGLQSV